MASEVAIGISYPPFPGLENAPNAPQSPVGPAPTRHTPVQPATQPPSSRMEHPPQTTPPQPARTQPPAVAVSPLNNIPADIATHRALLFALDTPVQLTPPVWERFWPYIDNVWCIHQKPNPAPSTGIAKVYGGCRLNRKTNFPPPVIHENSRPRQRREGGTCKAKFRLTVYPDGRRVIERTGEAHTHTLEHIDSIKRNSGVRNLVLSSFFKSWEAGGILAYLRDTSAVSFQSTSSPSSDLLKDAGGLFLSRQEVQNILNGALKKAYPGQDISEVKKQMDKYKNYTTCNYKGCNAPAFADIKALMEHRKSVHGLRSHDHSDKLYACPDKGCWRRKKSKGFATVLGLEEHMREKHGGAEAGIDIPTAGMETNDGGIEPDFPGQVDSEDGLNLNLNLSTIPPFPGLLPDPITPDSSGEEPQHELQLSDKNEDVRAEQSSKALTQVERERMVIRIKRLVIERQKLDLEIQRLNRAVYGDERKGADGVGDGG